MMSYVQRLNKQSRIVCNLLLMNIHKAASRFAIFYIYYFLDRLILKFVIHPVIIGKPRALIVRLDNIGDFVLWRNSAQLLIDDLTEKGYLVTLAANSVWADLAKESLSIDQIIAIDKTQFVKSPVYRFTTLLSLRYEGFELAINPVFSRELVFGDPLVYASKAARKISFAGDRSNLTKLHKYLSDRIYTWLVDVPLKTKHELEKNKLFLVALGINQAAFLRPKLSISLSANLKEILPVNYAVLAIGASWVGRRWPVDRFEKIASWLADNYGLKIVVIGGAEDISDGDFVAGVNGMNLCGKTNLSELPVILNRATIAISNETGAIHFALASATNAICILGGGHFGRFLPYPKIEDSKPVPISIFMDMDCFGCGWHCCHERLPDRPVLCIDNITIE